MADNRTKEGQEQLILEKVRKEGGFSVFWITENQRRAHAAERLINRGAIIRQPDHYPWCAYLVADKMEELNERN